MESYKGVTGDMVFDPNCKNIVPMYLATVHGGKYQFRRYPMQIPYAKVGEAGVHYNGPPLADAAAGPMRIGIFGPDAEGVVARISPLLAPYSGRYSLIAVPSDVPWGKASTGLVKLIYDQEALGLIATDRNSSHLAEQLAAKSFVPLIAVSADHTLTSVNIPWVIRLPGRYTDRGRAVPLSGGSREIGTEPRAAAGDPGFHRTRISAGLDRRSRRDGVNRSGRGKVIRW